MYYHSKRCTERRKDVDKPYIRPAWERERSSLVVGGESATDSSFGNDTDINKIVARFARDGEIPPPTQKPEYADVTTLQKDLTELMQQTSEARVALDALKAQQMQIQKDKEKAEREELQTLRERFANSKEQSDEPVA